MTLARVPVYSGFLLSGFLLSLLGAALPGWGFHLTEDHATAGWLFFAVAVGLLAASQLPRTWASPPAGCCLAVLSLLTFGFFPAPVRFAIQLAAWFTVGFASGLLNRRMIESLAVAYRANPPVAVAKVAITFIAGCFTAGVFTSAGFRFGFVSQTPAALALVPAAFALLYWRQPLPVVSTLESPASPYVSQFSRPGIMIVTLLLVVQSGSVWIAGGWLPIFLSHRIGLGPEDALAWLAVYWFVLVAGLLGGWYSLRLVRRSRMLVISSATVLVSCFLLSSTNNTLGAGAAVVVLALGFSGLSVLLAQNLRPRLPGYNPVTLNRLLMLMLAGGLFSAWLAGMLASVWGLTAILILPVMNTLSATALLLVLWLESKVTGR